MTEQPNPASGRDDVFRALHGWLDGREAKGRETYGRSLETFNGRDAGRDLREELLDALVYAQQDAMERAELVGLLRRAYYELDSALSREARIVQRDMRHLLGLGPEQWR